MSDSLRIYKEKIILFVDDSNRSFCMSVSPTTRVMAAIPVVGEAVSAKWMVPVAAPAFQLGLQIERDKQEIEAKTSELAGKMVGLQNETKWLELRAAFTQFGSEESRQKFEEDRLKLITKTEDLKSEMEQYEAVIEKMHCKAHRVGHAILEKAYTERQQLSVPNVIRNGLSIGAGAALVSAGAAAATGPVGVFVAYNAASACYTCGIKSRQDRALQELEATKLLEPGEEEKIQLLLDNTSEEESWDVLGAALDSSSPKAQSIDLVVSNDDYFSTENGKKSTPFADEDTQLD